MVASYPRVHHSCHLEVKKKMTSNNSSQKEDGMYLAFPTREGDGTPLQYSCLENPMDGGAW